MIQLPMEGALGSVRSVTTCHTMASQVQDTRLISQPSVSYVPVTLLLLVPVGVSINPGQLVDLMELLW